MQHLLDLMVAILGEQVQGLQAF